MKPDRDEVLWRFAEEYKADPTALARWCRRYPQYVEDLVAETALSPGAALPSTEEAKAFSVAALGGEPSPIADTMLAAMRALHDRRIRHLDSIVERARSLGHDAARLSAMLGLGKTIVAKLERRLLDPATIPDDLLRRLSEILRVPIESVRRYLDGPPTLARAASYRAGRAPRLQVTESLAAYRAELRFLIALHSDRNAEETVDRKEKPQAGTSRESFLTAVLSAPDMADAQKNEWLKHAE